MKHAHHIFHICVTESPPYKLRHDRELDQLWHEVEAAQAEAAAIALEHAKDQTSRRRVSELGMTSKRRVRALENALRRGNEAAADATARVEAHEQVGTCF